MFGVPQYPCAVVTDTGAILPRVLLIPQDGYEYLWGDVDRLSREVRVNAQEICDLCESSERLPAHIANVLYSAGESGMGFHYFQLVLSDGRRFDYRSGSVIDFPETPFGFALTDVVEAIPHSGLGLDSDACYGTKDFMLCAFARATNA